MWLSEERHTQQINLTPSQVILMYCITPFAIVIGREIEVYFYYNLTTSRILYNNVMLYTISLLQYIYDVAIFCHVKSGSCDLLCRRYSAT